MLEIFYVTEKRRSFRGLYAPYSLGANLTFLDVGPT